MKNIIDNKKEKNVSTPKNPEAKPETVLSASKIEEIATKTIGDIHSSTNLSINQKSNLIESPNTKKDFPEEVAILDKINQALISLKNHSIEKIIKIQEKFFNGNEKLNKIKESIEESSKRVNLAFKILLYCITINSSLLNSAEASDISKKTKIENQTKIEWRAKNIKKEEKLKIEKDILYQKKWLETYMNSPKYKERLQKEYLRSEDLIKKTPLNHNNSSLDLTQNHKFFTFKLDEKGDTIAIINNLDKNVSYKNGRTMPIEEFVEIVNEKKILEKFLPPPDTSNISEKDQKAINELYQLRLAKLKWSVIIIVDSILNKNGGDSGNIGEYSDEYNIIKLIRKYEQRDKKAPVHEMSHQTTFDLLEGTNLLLEERSTGDT